MKLSTERKLKIRRYIIICSIIIGTIGLLYSLIWFVIPARYDITLEKPFKDAAKFPMGVAVDVNNLKTNAPYEALICTHYNSITPENCMKMGPLRPTNDTFFWDDAEYLVNYAESIGAIVHGHCLVWHQQVPKWLETFIGTREEWMAILENHIKTVVDHFKGRIASWDVVNEAIDGETMRDTIWLQNIGSDYVKYAFIWAHEADPDVKLYYNDYGIETDPDKLEAVLGLLKPLINEGVPIQGIGFQGHFTASWSLVSRIKDAVERINQETLEVRISELDLSMNSRDLYKTYTIGLADYQSRLYEAITRAFLNIKNLTGITFWGVSDNHSWIRMYHNPDWPLLFDDSYKPKPAAEKILNILLAI